VEHPIPQPELVRPWRTATLVATAIAGVELVLLVVAGIVLLGRSLAPGPHSTTPPRSHATSPAGTLRTPAARTYRPPVARLSPAQTGVLVLNGNGVRGAAAAAAALVRARGYRVEKVGNAPRTGYPRSIVMYRPGFLAEAKRFARELNVGVVAPLDGMKPAQLDGGQLVLVLGTSR
jgi:LytR cell envelope-related transcriptional attenuator